MTNSKKLKGFFDMIGSPTKDDFATLVGVSRMTINRYENGINEIPPERKETINKLFNKYGYDKQIA